MRPAIPYKYVLETIDPETKKTIMDILCEELCVSYDEVYKNLEIMRIKNPKIFMEFVNRRKEITNEMIQKGTLPSDARHQKLWDFNYLKRYTEVNEVYLFYTTTQGSTKMIMKRGFVPEASKSNPHFVQINFTDTITQMDILSDNPGRRESDNTKLAILLCRVVLGNVISCPDKGCPVQQDILCSVCLSCDQQNENANIPSRGDGEGTVSPRNDSQTEKCWATQHHSVVVEIQQQRQRRFVVSDHRQCFPEFIITYKKFGKGLPSLHLPPRGVKIVSSQAGRLRSSGSETSIKPEPMDTGDPIMSVSQYCLRL